MTRLLVFLAILSIAALTIPAGVSAAPITLSGTITYDGPYDGDTLYVALLDTANADVVLLDILGIDVGNSPLSVPYAFGLDTDTAPPQVWIASFLDVDGGGMSDISGLDVMGWYGSTPIAESIPTSTSRSGLDFFLPTGEIHGSVTFAAGQEGAEIWPTPFTLCGGAWGINRPRVVIHAPGVYAMVGMYAGSYCIHAVGFGPGSYPPIVCYGDPTCIAPGSVDVAEGEVVNGVSLSFAGQVPSQGTTWGRLKARYP